jgi:hypothetical protein
MFSTSGSRLISFYFEVFCSAEYGPVKLVEKAEAAMNKSHLCKEGMNHE